MSTTYLGYVAGMLTMVSFLPQLVRTLRTKETKDLSMGMFGLLLAGACCWLAYGVLTANRPVIYTNIGVVALNVALLSAKFRYE